MRKLISSFFLLPLFFFFFVNTASAHCDSLDGPVVKAATKALNTGKINYALIWVKKEEEEKIRRAFKKAQRKRKNAKSSKDLENIDLDFFGYLVKVHREGEGERYEGLKAAGATDPGILLADAAIESRNIEEVLKHVSSTNNQKVLHHLFHKLSESLDYGVDDLTGGREYVKNYAQFIHACEAAIAGKEIEEHLHHPH